MKIKSISIKNFRGIGSDGITVPLSNLGILIGDNGTSKTAILEAMNFCMMQNFSASRLSINDFYEGEDNEIEIIVNFDTEFYVYIPDGWAKQKIKCLAVVLKAHKRSSASAGKAFNELVVFNHFYLPVVPKSGEGWQITRGTGTKMEISERQLDVNYASADVPRVFYFSKSRERQLAIGYNSSLSNVIDELNWRFEKIQRTKPEPNKFKIKNKELHKYIFENTDGDSLEKTIEALNIKLKTLDIEPISLNLLKTLTPYDHAELVRSFDGFELPLSQSGSGIEMIVSILFLETLACISDEEILIVVDEPELHLHPSLQDKLIKYLSNLSGSTQVILSTHSPFLFKNSINKPKVSVLVTKCISGKAEVQDANTLGFGLLKWSPSWGEVCYFAYDLPTAEFHDDLYSALQDKENKEKIAEIEVWFISKGQTKEISWTNASGSTIRETLMTYIRNRIHHGDNQNRPMYTAEQLKDSIERMIVLLK